MVGNTRKKTDLNPNNSVDCVIFGFDFEQIKVLLIDRGQNLGNSKNLRALPGNLIYEVAITHWVKFTHSHIQVVQEKSLYWINLQSGHFEIPEDPTDEGSNQFLFENPSHFEENQPGFSDFKLFFKQNFEKTIVFLLNKQIFQKILKTNLSFFTERIIFSNTLLKMIVFY